MQLKFLTLGFISAAVFSNVVYASGPSVVNLEDTHISVDHVLTDILNHLNAKNLLKNFNLDAISHVADSRGDRLSRRKLNDALRRREWEADEDENEADEEEEDEDEEDEDENEPDEEEEDEDEEDEDENEPDEEEEDEDEADESSVSKVSRRSTQTEEEMDPEAEDEAEEEEQDKETEETEEDEEEQEEGEEQEDENVMRMVRRTIPAVGGLLGGQSSDNGAPGASRGDSGAITDKVAGLAGKLVSAGI